MENVNPFLAAPSSKKRLTLFGIYVGMIGSIMVSSGTSTLLPAMAADIGGTEYYSLVSNVSGPISVCLMVLYGYLGSRNPASKRKLFCLSMLIGAVVMLSRGLSSSMLFNVGMGALWGFSSAGIYVIGFSIIRDMYDIKKAAVYLGAIGTMMSIGMLVGPTITGLLIDTVSWRAACHFVWPFLLVAGLLVFFGVKANTEETKSMAVDSGAFDVVGALALMVFLIPLILALSLGSSFIPFGSLISNLLFAFTIIGFIVLILDIRKKGKAAIIPATVLKDRNVLCLTASNLFFNLSGMAIFFFMPSYVLYVMGGSATQASLTTTMMSVLGLVLSPILGKMIGKAGNAKGVILMGTTVRVAVTLAFLFLLSPNTSLFVIYALMLCGGIYNCQQSVTFSTAPQIQIKQELRVLGNSVIQVAQNLGSAIGVAVYTLIIGMYGIAEGMKVALMTAVVTALLGAAFSLFLKKLEESAPKTKNGTA